MGDSNYRRKPRKGEPRGSAIYHVVYEHEGYVRSAQSIFKMVRKAQQITPGNYRILFLDIDGHLLPDGQYDREMYLLQQRFIRTWLMPYLTRASFPLSNHQPLTHPDIPQCNVLPDCIPEEILSLDIGASD